MFQWLLPMWLSGVSVIIGPCVARVSPQPSVREHRGSMQGHHSLFSSLFSNVCASSWVFSRSALFLLFISGSSCVVLLLFSSSSSSFSSFLSSSSFSSFSSFLPLSLPSLSSPSSFFLLFPCYNIILYSSPTFPVDILLWILFTQGCVTRMVGPDPRLTQPAFIPCNQGYCGACLLQRLGIMNSHRARHTVCKLVVLTLVTFCSASLLFYVLYFLCFSLLFFCMWVSVGFARRLIWEGKINSDY